jgi:hypothetical protein
MTAPAVTGRLTLKTTLKTTGVAGEEALLLGDML